MNVGLELAIVANVDANAMIGIATPIACMEYVRFANVRSLFEFEKHFSDLY